LLASSVGLLDVQMGRQSPLHSSLAVDKVVRMPCKGPPHLLGRNWLLGAAPDSLFSSPLASGHLHENRFLCVELACLFSVHAYQPSSLRVRLLGRYDPGLQISLLHLPACENFNLVSQLKGCCLELRGVGSVPKACFWLLGLQGSHRGEGSR
jgi:hypothetical protein